MPRAPAPAPLRQRPCSPASIRRSAAPPSRSIRSSPRSRPRVLLRFVEPIATAEAIARGAGRGGAPAGRRCSREAGLGVRRLVLVCERVDGERADRRDRHRPRHPRRRPSAAPAVREDRDDRARLRHRARCASSPPGSSRSAPQPIAGALAGEQPAPDLAAAGRPARRPPRRAPRSTGSSAVESDVPERSVRRVGPLAAAAAWPRLAAPGPPALAARAGRAMSSPCSPTGRRAASPGAAAPTGSPPPTAPSASMANGGSAAPSARRCATISRSRTRKAPASGCSAAATAWIPRTGDLSWYLHGVFA